MQLIPEPIGGQDKGRPGKLAHLTELEITAYLQQVMLMWGTRPALLRAEGVAPKNQLAGYTQAKAANTKLD